MIDITFRTAEGTSVDMQWPCVPRMGECVDLDGIPRRVVDVKYVYTGTRIDGKARVAVHIQMGSLK